MRSENMEINPDDQMKKSLHSSIEVKLASTQHPLTDVDNNMHPQKSQKQHHNQQKQIRQKTAHNGAQSHNTKSKADILSGYSFSRFEAISQSSQKDKPTGFSCQPNQQDPQISSKKQINRAPTSAKAISSNKLIEAPVEVKSFHYDEFKMAHPENKHEYIFQYDFITPAQVLSKFQKLATSRGMTSKLGQNQASVIKRAPLFKSILSLCFRNSDFDSQVYRLNCLPEKRCSITQESGNDQSYYSFREEFLLLLWQDKFLVCGSLHQNLRHFIRQFNTPKEGSHKNNFHGRIDTLKIQIQKIMKAQLIDQGDQSKKFKQKLELNSKVSGMNQMDGIKLQIRQMQFTLKIELESEMRKEEAIKKIRQENQNHQQSADKNSLVEKGKQLVTPSIERMLMSIFYLHLDLEGIVKRFTLKEKDIGDFEKKKMIIKGSLSPLQILNYIELKQFSKILQANPSQFSIILERSIKILSCLKFSSYPSPEQILEVVSIFKSTVLKEAQSYCKSINETKVKLQDHNNEERTLLQLSIFCIIMCENRDIYPTIETAIIFCPLHQPQLKGSQEEAVEGAKILRRAINFVNNEWEL